MHAATYVFNAAYTRFYIKISFVFRYVLMTEIYIRFGKVVESADEMGNVTLVECWRMLKSFICYLYSFGFRSTEDISTEISVTDG